jgi:CheY-like chemotaxis protein
MKIKRILIVEDDEFSRGAMEKLLQSSGYEVESSSNGEEALKSLNEKYFDILITDLQMPGMDGFELIQKAKVIQPNLKTVIITGFVNEGTKERVKTEGIDGLFQKPIVWEKLFLFLGHLLRSKNSKNHPFLEVPHKLRVRPIFRGIILIFLVFLFILFNLRESNGEETLYVQYRPLLRPEIRRDCSKSLSSILSEEQLSVLKDLQNSFYKEATPIRRELIILNMEFRYLISDPKIDPKILLDRQSKILELQTKLERLSFSYQMKARSIFTNDQLDRLPMDCMLGMGTEFGINVGIGRGPRRWYNR